MSHIPSLARWLARILGLSLAALVGLFAIGERFEFGQLTFITAAMWAVFIVAVIGMLALWRWELAGGLMVITGMSVFYMINFLDSGKLPGGWMLPICIVPGLLAVVAWTTSRSRRATLTL